MILLAALVLLVPLMILRGLVLATIWRWFAVPVFDAPELSVPAAIGVSLIVFYLTARPDSERGLDGEELGKQVIFAVFTAGVTLALAWGVLQFMPEVQ